MVSQTEQLVIETVGLTKRFRDFWGHTRVIAVDNLDLSIHSGEVFGLLGPNGSGKSTTIKMLLGLLFPSRGVAKILGHPPGEVKINHRIGFLPEESYLYPFLNARETLDFYGRIFGLSRPERKRRIESLLKMVGLSSNARRPIGEFSKGMARRIGLAQALINDPDLLILDEPTSGLDPLGTRQIKDLISELGRRGKTVLLCSHLLGDVEDVCDRIGIMYGGKLRQIGSMDELLTDRQVTQIRSKHLTPEVIAKIQSLVPDDSLEVESPRERLEDYFLQIVEQAQAEQIPTSGAVIGGEVSDFLGQTETSAPESEQVLDKLVSGKEVDPIAVSEKRETMVAVDREEDARNEIVDSLVAHQEKEVSEPLSSPVDSDSSRSEQVDHSLIDQLTTRQNENRSGTDQDGPNRTPPKKS
jgi:ABC-2 type transport system ATP-binding protein